MAQKKLIRFAAIKTYPHVLENPEGMPGKWNDFFKNSNTITLELACGRGEYAVGLGRLFPDRNFVGVDIKGNRIYVGAKKALDEKLDNVGFLRTHIDKIATYFNPSEVQDIWITFPDPQLRLSRTKKRLTHPKFLRLYQQILAPGGFIHLKTDSPDLYAFTKLVIDLYGLELLEDDDNVYASSTIKKELAIKTHYEGLDIAKSNRVHYLRFALPSAPLSEDLDEKLQELIKVNDEAVS
jgi:tRNA (guanine-N7-)-methyltransferase